MLKIKLFNPQHPLEHQELELSDHRLKDDGCLIGNSPSCGLMLPSMEVQEVHGKLFTEKGKYYFQDLTKEGKTQYNDERVKQKQSYPLETDDIIRIGEFVLIVDGLPIKRKSKFSKKKKKNNPSSQSSKKRSLQNIKALTRKNRRSHDKKIESNEQQPQTLTKAKTTVNNSQSASVSISTASLLPKVKESVSNTLENTASALNSNPPTLNGINWWSKGELTVRCLNIIQETSDVKTFRFAATSPTLFNYKPGQFVTLKLNINDKIIKRAYSISSTPSRPHTLEITVKRVPPPVDFPDAPPGLVSNWLHDHLKVGDEITLTGPSGKFTCVDNNASKLLFISAGSGITPMMSMSRWALDTVANRDIVFLHSAKTPRDIVYRKELESMAANHNNFNLALTITRNSINESWWGFTGRLSEILLPAICPDFQDRVIYVCGPDSFMKGVKNLVNSLRFPMENYYQESFGSSKKKQSSSKEKNDNLPIVTTHNHITNNDPVTTSKSVTSASGNTSYPVVFAKSGKEVICDKQMSLLDLAEQEMVDIDCSCRSGGCGSCKVKKREGEIRYDSEPDGLDANDQEEGYILACIAYPQGKVVIEV